LICFYKLRKLFFKKLLKDCQWILDCGWAMLFNYFRKLLSEFINRSFLSLPFLWKYVHKNSFWNHLFHLINLCLIFFIYLSIVIIFRSLSFFDCVKVYWVSIMHWDDNFIITLLYISGSWRRICYFPINLHLFFFILLLIAVMKSHSFWFFNS